MNNVFSFLLHPRAVILLVIKKVGSEAPPPPYIPGMETIIDRSLYVRYGTTVQYCCAVQEFPTFLVPECCIVN